MKPKPYPRDKKILESYEKDFQAKKQKLASLGPEYAYYYKNFKEYELERKYGLLMEEELEVRLANLSTGFEELIQIDIEELKKDNIEFKKTGKRRVIHVRLLDPFRNHKKREEEIEFKEQAKRQHLLLRSMINSEKLLSEYLMKLTNHYGKLSKSSCKELDVYSYKTAHENSIHEIEEILMQRREQISKQQNLVDEIGEDLSSFPANSVADRKVLSIYDYFLEIKGLGILKTFSNNSLSKDLEEFHGLRNELILLQGMFTSLEREFQTYSISELQLEANFISYLDKMLFLLEHYLYSPLQKNESKSKGFKYFWNKWIK